MRPTGAAIYDMQTIMGDVSFTDARAQLEKYIETLAKKVPCLLEYGLMKYRIWKPHRFWIIVDGDTVVRVLPDHEGHTGSYAQSRGGAPSRERRREGARNDLLHERLAQIEHKNGVELIRLVQSIPEAVKRCLNFAAKRGEISDRQRRQAILSRTVLAAVCGVDESRVGHWIAGRERMPLAHRRTLLLVAFCEPVDVPELDPTL